MRKEEIIIQAYELCGWIEEETDYITSLSVIPSSSITFYIHDHEKVVFSISLENINSFVKIKEFINHHKQTA